MTIVQKKDLRWNERKDDDDDDKKKKKDKIK